MLPGEASRSGRAALIALRELALALVAAALALGAAGCGDSDGAGSGDEPAEGESALTVTLDPDGPEGKEEELTEEVSCGEDSDDAACAAIADLDPDDLEPLSPDVACTELYGGPDTASLEGTINGEEVDVDLTRSNGCEIERFDAALPLLQALHPDYEPGASLDA